VFIDTEEASLKAGDIRALADNGVFDKNAIAADLTALCRGRHQGRTIAGEITLTKAVGTAPEDLVAASLAFDALQDPPQTA